MRIRGSIAPKFPGPTLNSERTSRTRPITRDEFLRLKKGDKVIICVEDSPILASFNLLNVAAAFEVEFLGRHNRGPGSRSRADCRFLGRMTHSFHWSLLRIADFDRSTLHEVIGYDS
jgi:hypothetical protein